MFTIFRKKKITEDQLANFFVSSLLNLVDKGFPDVAAMINADPEFSAPPCLAAADSDKFLLIVASGNIQLLSKHFERMQDVRLAESINRKLANALGVEPQKLKELLNKYQSWMTRINHPSKNIHYAMSKAVFYKYDLNQFQSEYFRNMNTPNPIFLKRLDEVIAQFIWNWENYKEEYRITQG